MVFENLSDKGRETYTKYCMRVKGGVMPDDVILSDENRRKCGDFMEERLNADRLRESGFEPWCRILMYGAPGTGKTYLSQAIAGRLGMPMLHVDISQLAAERVAAAIADIFDLADEMGGALIFLDECDSICWARDDADNGDSAAIRRAVNVLFQQLDRMDSRHIFISATNLYDKLDPAFTRRFNVLMKFIRPDVADFGKAVERFIDPGFEYLRDMEPAIRNVVNEQARYYRSMSYFQIKDWVHRAEKAAALAGRKVIAESAVYAMLMQAMRMEVKHDSHGGAYLHQYGVQNR